LGLFPHILTVGPRKQCVIIRHLPRPKSSRSLSIWGIPAQQIGLPA
jgi:hypothetical protein